MTERKDFIRKVLAGTFFLTGIFMILLVVLVLGIQRGFNEAKFPVKVLFHEVGGLTIGAPVNLSGVNVGTIADISFLEKDMEGRGVVVTLSVYKRFEPQVAKASRFAIKTAGVLGEKSLEISRDIQSKEVMDFSEPVIGEDPLDVQDLANIFGDAAIALEKTSDEMHSIIVEVQRISETSKRMLNRIEQRIIDGNLFKVF